MGSLNADLASVRLGDSSLLVGILSARTTVTMRAQYSPSRNPLGGSIRTVTRLVSPGLSVTRVGMPEIHRPAKGAVGAGLSITVSCQRRRRHSGSIMTLSFAGQYGWANNTFTSACVGLVPELLNSKVADRVSGLNTITRGDTRTTCAARMDVETESSPPETCVRATEGTAAPDSAPSATTPA